MSVDAFSAIASTESLINPDHTCSLYLPNEIQQTSSFPLLILQAIMIFCGWWLLMPFCWLRTHGQAGCMFGSWVQGEVLRRQTRWSRVYVFVVMSLVATALSLSLSLWPHCVVEGNNKAATTEARRLSTNKFLPCLSCVQLGTRHSGDMARRLLSQKRGVMSPLKL